MKKIDPNLIYPGSDLTNVFPEEGMDKHMTPTQAQIEASAFKPCPFCGSADIRCTNHGKVSHDPWHRDDDVWSMCCYKCGATFPNRYRQELLVENWNRRAASAEVEATIDDAIENSMTDTRNKDIRIATIERCAKVADSFGYSGYEQIADAIAAAIRALKES
jgi:Lar family restriction alleviation protein